MSMTNNDAYEGETRRLETPCPLCQGTLFTWGRLAAGHDVTYLQPDYSTFDILFQNYPKLRARRCATCGNVQLFVEEHK